MEFNYIEDEATQLTEEQWDRILAWHRKRTGKAIETQLFPIQIDPILPVDTIRIGDTTIYNIAEDKP